MTVLELYSSCRRLCAAEREGLLLECASLYAIEVGRSWKVAETQEVSPR